MSDHLVCLAGDQSVENLALPCRQALNASHSQYDLTRRSQTGWIIGSMFGLIPFADIDADCADSNGVR